MDILKILILQYLSYLGAIMLLGEVKAPGAYPMVGNVTALNCSHTGWWVYRLRGKK